MPKPIKQPKDIKYREVFEPDMERMVRALRIVLDIDPDYKQDEKHEIKKLSSNSR